MRRLWTLSALVALVAPSGALAADPALLKPAFHVHALEGVPEHVTISLAVPARHAVSVRYATQAGTAKPGSDYVSRRGTLRIAKGRRRASVDIRTVRDHVDELTETFTVRFSDPAGARLGRRKATLVKVLDRNATIASVDLHTIAEPARTGTAVPIGAVVKLTGRSAGTHPVTIGYEIVRVEETVDANDADVGTGRLRFEVGQTRKVIPGSVKGDALDEDDEHLLVVLTGDRGVYARPGGSIRITDDPADAPPTVSIGDLTVSEGVGGAAQVPLTLTAPSERSVTVTYTTTAGSATTEDFVMTTGTVTFVPDTTTAFAPVALIDDLTDEPDQSFTVTLSSPVDVVLGDTQATVTVTDDDPPPSLLLGDASTFEASGSGTLTVSLSRPSEFAVTVQPTFAAGGTATGHTACDQMVEPAPDFVLPANGFSVTIGPGATSAQFTVTYCDDLGEEGSETILFTLEQPVNAIIADGAGQLTIVDDEVPPGP